MHDHSKVNPLGKYSLTNPVNIAIKVGEKYGGIEIYERSKTSSKDSSWPLNTVTLGLLSRLRSIGLLSVGSPKERNTKLWSTSGERA